MKKVLAITFEGNHNVLKSTFEAANVDTTNIVVKSLGLEETTEQWIYNEKPDIIVLDARIPSGSIEDVYDELKAAIREANIHCKFYSINGVLNISDVAYIKELSTIETIRNQK